MSSTFTFAGYDLRWMTPLKGSSSTRSGGWGIWSRNDDKTPAIGHAAEVICSCSGQIEGVGVLDRTGRADVSSGGAPGRQGLPSQCCPTVSTIESPPRLPEEDRSIQCDTRDRSLVHYFQRA